MRLQHLIVIFLIIMLPIMLVLSQYIDSQLDMINLRNSYTTALINSTADAMRAYEINTMNNSYNEIATSKRRDVKAAMNAFFTSLATNMGVSGYRVEELQPYIPAIVFTGYDGYYVYAKTPKTQRYTYEEEKNSEGVLKEGNIKPGDSEPVYDLKPYVYYSAQYRNSAGTTDITINYTLDNYVSVMGTLNSEYIQESGYLLWNIPEVTTEELSENVVCKDKDSEGNKYISIDNCRYYYMYTNATKTFSKLYKSETKTETGTETNYFIISESGNYQDVDDSKVQSITDLSEATDINKYYYIENISSIYSINTLKPDTLKKLGYLTVNDLVVNDNESRTRLENSNNSAYQNISSTNEIFTDEKLFENHKQDIIKISIQENLKSALENYANGESRYKLPIFTEEDWQKIFSNITMIAFMQDLPVKFGTYNNYAIATSTGNKEYIPEDGVYFIDSTNTYHRITCRKILDREIDVNNLTGYKALDFERNNVSIEGKDTHYYYPHNATACYECIVSSNYEKLRDKDGNLNSKITGELKELFDSAVSREKVTQYKSTSFLATYH